MRVGVLALQGDVREHTRALERLGVSAPQVRLPDDLVHIDALVIPGGESTAIARLLEVSGLREEVANRLREGLPAFGTCAGLILLAEEILDGRSDQWSFARLDVTVRRNGYGRQTASFDTAVQLRDSVVVPGVFIRAPRIIKVGADVEVLATHDHGDGAHAVLVKQGVVWGCSFHPELTEDLTIHRMFVESVEALR
ncbi:MAG: pyridoxal 5'-phosphate synthase glutaminase subunit PdxT [Verrucomicrobiota bacterium]